MLSVASCIDRATAKTVERQSPRAVYAYEGVALQTFQAAERRGATKIYELPSGYWHHETELLREEADRNPAYAGTIEKLKDSREHLDRKDQEIATADHIVVPSSYVASTLRRLSIPVNKLHIVPYGSSANIGPARAQSTSRNAKLRVIFVGALTQRKGIGYLLEAVDQLGSRIELTLIGRKVGRSEAIDAAVQRHRWIPNLAHDRVIEVMSRHDVLVLPSLTEGFGLVITEALSAGLPVITTQNSGGPEVIRDGVEGFLVPIRSSQYIAERLEQLHRERDCLEAMSVAAITRSKEMTWANYRTNLATTIRDILLQCQ